MTQEAAQPRKEALQDQPSALELVRPVAVLVAICVVAAVLLGVVHGVTAPIATANAEQRAQQTYAALVPSAARFEPLACEIEGCEEALQALDEGGSAVGVVVVAAAKGYGGLVPVAVAFDLNGTVAGITVMDNDETPGLGSKVESKSYLAQYVGCAAEHLGQTDVDLISGATISSKATLAAFNIAVDAFQEMQ